MRGSGLTRYRPDFPSSQGGGSLGRFLGNALNDIKNTAKTSAKREGWKSFKNGGPLVLPSVFAGVQGIKRGAIQGAKRGVKRKANSAINLANAAAKRAVHDIFG